jgi:hypothetical protein
MNFYLEFYNPFINLSIKMKNSKTQPLLTISPIAQDNKYNGMFLFTIVYPDYGFELDDYKLKIIGVDEI